MLWPLPICMAVLRQRQSLRLIRVTEGDTELCVSGRRLIRRCHGNGQCNVLTEIIVQYFSSPYHDDREYDDFPISFIENYFIRVSTLLFSLHCKLKSNARSLWCRATSFQQVKQNRTSTQTKIDWGITWASRILEWCIYVSLK